MDKGQGLEEFLRQNNTNLQQAVETLMCLKTIMFKKDRSTSSTLLFHLVIGDLRTPDGTLESNLIDIYTEHYARDLRNIQDDK